MKPKKRNKRLMKTFGDRVKFYRDELGLPQHVVAKKATISGRYLAQAEAGKANPSLLVIEALAKTLDVKMEDLIKQPGKSS